MPLRHFISKALAVPSTICITILLSSGAWAGEVPEATILLDSSVYQSDLVIEARPLVEGRIVERRSNPTQASGEVVIAAVYRGSAKVGDTITVVGLNDYQKRSNSSAVPLGPKDDLILFLVKTPKEGMPDNDQSFTPIASLWGDGGIPARLVSGGVVYGFSARMPRFSHSPHERSYPLIAEISTRYHAFPKPELLSLFRKHLHESTARAADWHARLDRSPGADDIPWLISLLQQRYVPQPRNMFDYSVWLTSDSVADTAARRLAETGNLSAMIEAVGVNPNHVGDYAPAFATPGGRDYLLTRVTDRTLTNAHRKSVVALIDATGLWYNGVAHSGTEVPQGQAITPRNGGYATRIAQAIANLVAAGDDDTAIELLTLLNRQFYGWRGGWRNFSIDIEMEKDADDTAKELIDLYAKKGLPEEVRFLIENVVYDLGDNAYLQLQPPCVGYTTLAKPGVLDENITWPDTRKITGPSITVDHEFRETAGKASFNAVVLVLEELPGGATYIIPSGFNAAHHGMSYGIQYGQETLPLPPDFKPGRYRLHYRLMNGSTVVSDGHSSEAMLPQPPPATRPAESMQRDDVDEILPQPTPETPAPQAAAETPSIDLVAQLPNPIVATSKPSPRLGKLEIVAAILPVPVLLILWAIVRSKRRRRDRDGRYSN